MRGAFIFFGVILVAIGTICGMASSASYAVCASQASKMGFEYSWGPLQDCMINVDGRWALLESYKTARVQH